MKPNFSQDQTHSFTRDQSTKPSPSPSTSGWAQFKKRIGMAFRWLLLLLALALGAKAGNDWATSELAKHYSQQVEAMQKQYTEDLAYQRQANLELFAIPVTWAIQSEWFAKPQDFVDEAFSSLVQNTSFELAALVNEEGLFVFSTDRKFQGKNLSEFLDPSLLNAETPTVTNHSNGEQLLLVPFHQQGAAFFIYPSVTLPPQNEKKEVPDPSFSWK